MRRTIGLMIVALTGCGGEVRGASTDVAIAWNDFGKGTGMLGALSASAPWAFTHDPIEVGSDAILQSAFGKLFVLSAGDRTVRVVNPTQWTVERSYVLEPGDEPVDIQVVSPELAYLTRRNATRLLQLDLASGTMQDAVDLGIFADNDGNPDLGTMASDEGRLFVQLQRVNFDDPATIAQPYVAVIDLATQHLVDVDPVRDGIQAIELRGTFPKFKMQVVEETRRLLVSATGAFFDSGGIEVINLENLQSEGLAIREADGLTGADLGAFVMVAADRGFLAYSTDLLLSSHLHQFSLAGDVDPTELAVGLDYFSPAIAFDLRSNSVFFPVGGTVDSGLHVFDATTGARLNDRLIQTSGPPTDLIVLAAVPEPAGLSWLMLAWLAFVRSARAGELKDRAAALYRDGS